MIEMKLAKRSKLALILSLCCNIGGAKSFVLGTPYVGTGTILKPTSPTSSCRYQSSSYRNGFVSYPTLGALSSSSSDIVEKFRGSDRFDRWRYLQNFLDNECNGDDVNRIFFLVLDGFLKYPRPEFKGETGSPELTEDLRNKIENLLKDATTDGKILAFQEPNCSPGSAELIEQLKGLLPDPTDDEDASKSLWDTLISLHGREAVKFNEMNPSPEWNAICLVTRLLIHFDFLMYGIVDGPLV